MLGQEAAGCIGDQVGKWERCYQLSNLALVSDSMNLHDRAMPEITLNNGLSFLEP